MSREQPHQRSDGSLKTLDDDIVFHYEDCLAAILDCEIGLIGRYTHFGVTIADRRQLEQIGEQQAPDYQDPREQCIPLILEYSQVDSNVYFLKSWETAGPSTKPRDELAGWKTRPAGLYPYKNLSPSIFSLGQRKPQ